MLSNATIKLFKSITDNEYFDADDAIKAGADTNAIHDGFTPLMRAALFNRASLVRLLLWNNADPEKLVGGRIPLDLAWNHDSSASFCALAEHKISKQGPFWLKPDNQLATRVIKMPPSGILCEHFDFADKMCTSVLYKQSDGVTISHSRASFNNVARHLVLEADSLVHPRKHAPKYKRAEL